MGEASPTQASGRWRSAPRPAAVGEARRYVRLFLAGESRDLEDLEDLQDDAQLLVSELVTNALVHAGTDIEVVCSRQGPGVRVGVRDGSRLAPALRSYGPHAGTGRGLHLLQELADEWGVDAAEGGKTVWFTLGHASPGAGHGSWVPEEDPAQARAARPDTVGVVLLDVPLLLVQAWRQHAETLLREHLLAALDDADAADAGGVLLAHAHASEAMSLLESHIPALDLGEDPATRLQRATEPYVTSPWLTLPVPAAAVGHFDELDQILQDAVAMADRREMLNPTVQPELQSLRHWLCAEVRAQDAGEPPTAWALPEERIPSGKRPSWDSRSVRESEAAVVAVDDAGAILAVSRAAEVLVGYDAGELDGQRLLVLVPPRYRQAHVAGFTLFQLTGHTRLVGHTVAVPAWTRDGSEAPVGLHLSVQQVDAERTVFLAALS